MKYVMRNDIFPGEVQERHLEANIHTIKFGLAADRPDGSTHTKAYFSTDTFVLSIWTGDAWKSTTLS